VSVPTKSAESGKGDEVLPPGKRDASGFWYPAAYSDPRTLVRRRVRRRRDHGGRHGGQSTGTDGR